MVIFTFALHDINNGVSEWKWLYVQATQNGRENHRKRRK